MKIKVSDLDCYNRASDEERRKGRLSPTQGYDLGLFTEEAIREELRMFINMRGKELSLSSIRADLGNYNLFARMFLGSKIEIHSLQDISEKEMEEIASKWLLRNGYSLHFKKKKLDRENPSYSIHPLISFIRCLYKYLKPEKPFSFEEDVWEIEKMPFPVRTNPIRNVKSISFKKIIQDDIRSDFKKIIEIRLRTNEILTVLSDITAFNRFCSWLNIAYPQVQSFDDLNRTLMEDYLMHIRLEAKERENFRTDLSHLKSIMELAAKVLEYPFLIRILLKEDMGKDFMAIYESLEDEKIAEIYEALELGDEQAFRAYQLHGLLGTRISGILIIKKTDIRQTPDGSWFIYMDQRKGKPYKRPINEEELRIIKDSIDYTEKYYGDCEYIFVNDKNPNKPMQYGKVEYFLRSNYRKASVRDNNGKIKGANTHEMRRTFARKLMEQGESDVTIARLLGHNGTGSVSHYRKMASERMTEELCEYLEESSNETDEMIREMGLDFGGESNERPKK